MGAHEPHWQAGGRSRWGRRDDVEPALERSLRCGGWGLRPADSRLRGERKGSAVGRGERGTPELDALRPLARQDGRLAELGLSLVALRAGASIIVATRGAPRRIRAVSVDPMAIAGKHPPTTLSRADQASPGPSSRARSDGPERPRLSLHAEEICEPSTNGSTRKNGGLVRAARARADQRQPSTMNPTEGINHLYLGPRRCEPQRDQRAGAKPTR